MEKKKKQRRLKGREGRISEKKGKVENGLNDGSVN